MKETSYYIISVLLALGCVIGCAKRGSPTGGPEDIDPPVFIDASPENFTTHFEENEIRIYFNEYIKLEDPRRQIIVSPPMKPEAVITPLGSPRKYIEIDIQDTLRENTTYTINFGQSIVDNNEGNPLRFYKYVFSTGSYIDSLQVSGMVRDALQKTPDEFVSVMLYRIDSAYTDSIVYRQPPTYIAYSDSVNAFRIENIKAGAYQLMALKDYNGNYQFDPARDKIAFLKESISVPTDSVFQLNLFQEVLDFKMALPKHAARQHLIFGYQGIADSTAIKLVSPKPDGFDFRVLKDTETDTLHYWYRPKIEADSLLFEVTNQNYRDTMAVYLRELERDSLQLEAFPTGTLGLQQDFSLRANVPITAQDTTLISVMDKDSLPVSFSSEIDRNQNMLRLRFDKKEADVYRIKLLPGAITDYFGRESDTLAYRLRTLQISDYGVLTLNLQNIRDYPILVQLIDIENKVVNEMYSRDESVFSFTHIKPGEYFVRIIFDQNKNRMWDTGNYLKKRQPEKVVYYPDTLEVRANWDVSETFILQ